MTALCCIRCYSMNKLRCGFSCEIHTFFLLAKPLQCGLIMIQNIKEYVLLSLLCLIFFCGFQNSVYCAALIIKLWSVKNEVKCKILFLPRDKFASKPDKLGILFKNWILTVGGMMAHISRDGGSIPPSALGGCLQAAPGWYRFYLGTLASFCSPKTSWCL